MSLSIIECITPVTQKDVGSRLRITLKDKETLACTVSQHFPLYQLVGFTVDLNNTSLMLRRKLTETFGGSENVSRHLAAVEQIVASVSSSSTLINEFGTSPDEMPDRLDKYRQRVRAMNYVPTAIRGIYSNDLIAIDDELTAYVTSPAGMNQLRLGKVLSIDTSL